MNEIKGCWQYSVHEVIRGQTVQETRLYTRTSTIEALDGTNAFAVGTSLGFIQWICLGPIAYITNGRGIAVALDARLEILAGGRKLTLVLSPGNQAEAGAYAGQDGGDGDDCGLLNHARSDATMRRMRQWC